MLADQHHLKRGGSILLIAARRTSRLLLHSRQTFNKTTPSGNATSAVLVAPATTDALPPAQSVQPCRRNPPVLQAPLTAVCLQVIVQPGGSAASSPSRLPATVWLQRSQRAHLIARRCLQHTCGGSRHRRLAKAAPRCSRCPLTYTGSLLALAGSVQASRAPGLGSRSGHLAQMDSLTSWLCTSMLLLRYWPLFSEIDTCRPAGTAGPVSNSTACCQQSLKSP